MNKYFAIIFFLSLSYAISFNFGLGSNIKRTPSSEDEVGLTDLKTSTSVVIKSVSMNIVGNDDVATLTSEIQIKYTGKTMQQVATHLMNIPIFDDMAEISRVKEGDKARQATVKSILSDKAYSMVKSSWLNLGIKYSMGDTRAICGFNVSGKIFVNVCNNDSSHKGTNLRMSKLISTTRCDEINNEIICKLNLTL